MDSQNLGYTKILKDVENFLQAQEKVISVLSQSGFGIISEIDVKKTMKEKIGAEINPYKILGACNPHMAKRALELDKYIGLLLPCNVILFEDEQKNIVVSFLRPKEMFKLINTPQMEEIAEQVDELINKAFKLL